MKNIIFNKIEIKNFLSIGNEPLIIDFKSGLNIITGKNLDKIDRQNGIGKSSIIDAIYFTLYGESLREVDKIEQLCNYRTKKTTETILYFDVIENNIKQEVKIIRNLKPSKVEIYIDSLNKTLDSIANNKTFISKLVNYDSNTFKNCILMSLNNTVSFMLKKKQEKRDFIESIFNLSIFSELLSITKKRTTNTNQDFEKNTVLFDELTRNIITYQNEKNNIDIEKQKKVKSIDNEIEDLKENITSNEKEIYKIQKIDFITQYQIIDKDILEYNEKLFLYNTDLVNINNNITENNTKISLFNQQLDEIKKFPGSINEWNQKLLNVINSITENQNTLIPLKIQEYDNNIKNYLAQKLILNQERQNFDTKKDQQKQSYTILKTNLQQKNNDLEKISNKSNICPTCRREFSLKEKQIVDSEKNNIQIDISNISNNINNVTNILNSIENDINININNIGKIDKEIDLIKSSQNKVLALENNIQKLEKERELLEYSILNNTKLDEISKNIISCNSLLNTLQNNKNIILQNITNVNSSLNKSENNKKDLYISEQKIGTYQNQNNEYNKKIIQLEDAKNAISNSTNQFQNLIDNTQIRKHNLLVSIENQKNELQLLDQAKFVFSEEGVKSYLIKKTLDLFNNRLSFYLKQLDSKYACFFNEYFEEEILNDIGETYSYNNLSNAERKAIDFACLFTFMDIRRLQGDVSINISFYDELLDTSLDVTGINIVLDILKERIEKYNESMYIISHRKEAIKYATSDIIYLEMSNGITRRTILDI